MFYSMKVGELTARHRDVKAQGNKGELIIGFYHKVLQMFSCVSIESVLTCSMFWFENGT